MKKRIIIISQGRSGSTLLQRVLINSIDQCFISGENKGFWNHIYDSYLAFKYIDKQERLHARMHQQEPYTYNNDNYKPCWTNLMTERSLLNHYRILFDSMYQADMFDVFGFKTIRPHNDLAGFVKFMQLLFPDIIILGTVRHIDTLVKSGWWRETDRNDLIRQERAIRSVPDIYTVPFEKMQENSLKSVFDHIGCFYDINKLRTVLSKKL